MTTRPKTDGRAAALLQRFGGKAGRLIPSQVDVERLMGVAVLVSLAMVVRKYVVSRHLPHPFNSDPSQSFMDFYNTAYWANNAGTYRIWHSVYPPLSFLFTRLITNHSCYTQEPMLARTCDLAAVRFIFAIFFANSILVFLALRRSAVVAVVPRSVALCLGLPMLYGLELGNLIITCFTFFVLAESELLKIFWIRQLCRGVYCNLKLYLLVTIFPFVLRRHVRWVATISIFGLIVYVTTYLVFGAGSPMELAKDIFSYVDDQTILYRDQNHLGMIAAISHNIWNKTALIVVRCGELLAVIGILIGGLSDCPVDGRRMLALVLSIVSSEAAIHTQGFSADYTQIFLIFLIFLETEANPYATAIVASSYLLCIHVDILVFSAYANEAVSYLSGRIVRVDYGLTLGQFVRPVLLVLVQVCLVVLIWREAAPASSAARWRIR